MKKLLTFLLLLCSMESISQNRQSLSAAEQYVLRKTVNTYQLNERDIIHILPTVKLYVKSREQVFGKLKGEEREAALLTLEEEYKRSIVLLTRK